MKRGATHVMDTVAKQVFESRLSPDWVWRPQDPDYGIDYMVEIWENSAFTGLTFGVQLKGKESLSRSHGFLRVSFESDHLAHYLDKIRQPVFLVLVDRSRKCGYWIFLQRYVLSELEGKNWRGQKTVTIQVPPENSLGDSSRLREAVADATRFMDALHPASIELAIRNQKLKLESLDPRFRVSVTATDEGQQYELAATQSVQIKLSGEVGQIEKLVEHGAPVPKAGIQVTGSALIEKMLEEAQTIQLSHTADVMVRLSGVDADGTGISDTIDIPGKAEGGTNETRILADLARSPLHLEITLLREPRSIRAAGYFDPGKWVGQQISHLAYFNQISSILESISSDGRLLLQCLQDGNRHFSAVFSPESVAGLRGFAAFVSILKRAREIGRRFSIAPVLRADLGIEEADEIEAIFRLVTENEHHEPGRSLAVKMMLDRSGVETLLAMPEAGAEGATLTLLNETNRFPFLGQDVELGPMERVLTNAHLVSDRNELDTALQDRTADFIEVRFRGTERSEVVHRRRPAP